MRIAIPKESVPGEARVAILPETVKRLVQRKLDISVEAGAGAGAMASDREYQEAGARVEPSADALYTAADLVVKVHAPNAAEVARLREGQALISLLYPLTNAELVKKLAAKRVIALAIDAIPRTTLAQMMDVLTSQATIAGYRAVVLAAHALPKLFPMMMTAAGTVPAAKVLVVGAGVAGLQAIATSRRMGAVVEAFDVRKVVKEQVESLGAKFVEVESEEDAETAGGYAREVSEEYRKKQAALLLQHISRCDACITTAHVPGKRAPVIITTEMVAAMRRGSVIVDLAAEQGGNCVLTKPGERVVTENGVVIIGERNMPSQMAVNASQMYSRNMEKLILHIVKEGALALDTQDEIVRGILITRGGEVVNPQVKQAMG